MLFYVGVDIMLILRYLVINWVIFLIIIDIDMICLIKFVSCFIFIL